MRFLLQFGWQRRGGSSFIVVNVVASLCSLFSVTSKEETTTSKEGLKENYLQLEAFRKQERRVLVSFQYKEALVVV